MLRCLLILFSGKVSKSIFRILIFFLFFKLLEAENP